MKLWWQIAAGILVARFLYEDLWRPVTKGITLTILKRSAGLRRMLRTNEAEERRALREAGLTQEVSR